MRLASGKIPREIKSKVHFRRALFGERSKWAASNKPASSSGLTCLLTMALLHCHITKTGDIAWSRSA